MDAHTLAKTISSQVDIVQVVGRDVVLKRSGKNYRGLCPFHQEKTPSFFVHPQRGRYFCYGCHEGGDGVHFIQRMRGVGFREACEILISDFNLPIQLGVLSARGAQNRTEMELMIRIQDFAARFYHSRLQKGSQALAYLKTRNIDENSLKHFQIGVSAWETRDALYMALKKQTERFSGSSSVLQVAEKLGLWFLRGGNCEDRFFQRLMLPIRNIRGKVVGFGSRILTDAKDIPKYLNSSESAVFAKRHVLYGFYENLDDIRKSKELFLVEGYFDVIKLWQHGVRNVCATLGTSLSEEWVKRLKRSLKKLTIVFDGDPAGLRAMVQMAEYFFKYQWEPYVLVIPQGMDPDEFVDQRGVDAFHGLAKEAKRYFDFYFLQRFQEVKSSYFDLIALYEHLADVLVANSSVTVALSRMENYLSVADLGVEARGEILSRIRRSASSKERVFQHSYSDQSRQYTWVHARRDLIRLLQVVVYDPAFISEIPPELHNVLKEKEFCDLLPTLEEHRSVLEAIPRFEDRVQFVQYSQPTREASDVFFKALMECDRSGLEVDATRRVMFEETVQRLIHKEGIKARKMQLLEFRQRYSGGKMTWDEVVDSLENLQRKSIQGAEKTQDSES